MSLAKKSLIIYFSHTGENYMSDGIKNINNGNTEIIAEYIQQLTNADVFKIETVEEYPYNYRECCDIAKKELNENYRPKLKKYIDNIDEYDVIYIGYPIWWGTLPMAMLAQLEKLDFTGKIVKPFATHEGSKMGSSEDTINNVCTGADIKSGLAIRGSLAKASKSEIEKWIE